MALAVKATSQTYFLSCREIYDNEKTRQTSIWNKENRKGIWDVVINGTGDYAESYEVSFRSKEILFPKDEVDISGLLGITYWFDTFATIKIKEDKIKGQEKPIRWII